MTKNPPTSGSPAIASETTGISHPGRVSSPASTGGAGTFFEQHVDAYWLAQLLVQGIPPILHDSSVTEVHLQTAHLGWHTDDFLIVAENGSGSRRKLAGQVKRTFTVSASDDECKKAIQDFWKDFKNRPQFSPDADRFALATLRGNNTLLEHFSGLLDCSRAARDKAEFEHRLSTPGFLSAKAAQYFDEIRTIIGDTEGSIVSVAEVWPFLRVLHVLSLDLNTATRQTEAMIKTLLAHMTSQHDGIVAAEASWDALLREVGEGMPQARSFRRNDLSEALRQRHSLVGAREQRALRALNDHSTLILDGIRSTIGSYLHLGRGRLVQQVIEQLDSSQVVLISGAAGSGKSGIAKDAIGILAADHFVFSFRAEEFAHPHFDETLQTNQIPANAAMLGAMLAGQARKVLLVESVERLLEKSTRDAFTDLLTLVAKDKSWRLVLTCRAYSTDLVRACFLESASIGHSVVTVPPLDDRELKEVESNYPILARPLANTALRRVLRNPYVLDKALQILWSEERPLPQSEREFRALFWKEIVRADQRAAAGMPRRREDAFVQVALRRARALTLYADCGDLDPEVIDSLQRDSLIVSPPQSGVLVAPAHDILEDWAILHWIEEQYVTHEGPVRELSAAIGAYPAVRRTYRKWVAELVERDSGGADALFQTVVHDNGLSAHFRDDTLVSLLLSPSAAAFLERHTEALFQNDKQLLRRVIHLLRVACVTTPAWLAPSASPASLFNVPVGPAWACVLQVVQAHLASFAEEDRLLLLGFIEDWARGVTWQTPYPQGADSIAAIADWLLGNSGDYRLNEQRKRVLKIIAKIPNTDPKRFAALLQGRRGHKERDWAAGDFQQIVFDGLEGMPASRDLPDLVIKAANDYLLCSETSIRRDRFHSRELETLFGIEEGRNHDFFPASAYRGPWLSLLRYHRRKGLTFIISIFNHSADWYAHPRVPLEHVEPPYEIRLTFADGKFRTQWCNVRLWNLYRGTSVGPYVLQCLLMALERWLLEFAEANPRELDNLLVDILERSDSASLTAVVASIATAFPHACGETLLVLLRSRACVLIDHRRIVNESQAPSRLSALMPSVKAEDSVYNEERKDADARPHRRHDLESAIANLQLGPFAARVHEIFDRQRAEMPPMEQQNDDDRIWRLAMHRIDLRQYTVAEDKAEEALAPLEGKSGDKGQQYVRLELKQLEPDIKEMVDETAARLLPANARLDLLMWGLTVFGREQDGPNVAGQWRQRLQQAQNAGIGGGNENELGRGSPGFVAAVCVRDHWDEMSKDERDWCVDVVCSEVERERNEWNQFARVQRNSMSADRPCSWVLPLLLGKPLPDGFRSRVLQTLLVALTHAIDEVRSYTAWGIGSHLWTIDRKLALRCVNTLATEATLVQQAVDVDRTRPFDKRRTVDEIEAEAATTIRQRFFEADAIADDAYQTMDPTTWFGAEANGRILAILNYVPTEAAAVTGFKRLAQTLVAWWDADDERPSAGHHRQQRNHQTEPALSNLLENFLMRTSRDAATTVLQPVLDAIDRHPREVQWVLRGLISVEDRQPNTSQFWSMWKLFADRVKRAKWLACIADESPIGSEIMSAIFLGTWWKDEVRHWRSLEGHAENIHTLFEALPTSSMILDDYVRFLYHVGEQSLPQAFMRIARRLQQGDSRQMLRKGNTVFMLEVLLQRYVYARPLELKRQHDLREATLFLLDVLVDNGSSAAFRMRDDFVTPLVVT